jgi:hypothetical protein
LRDVEIQLDRRLFSRVFVVLLALSLFLVAILLGGRRFDWLAKLSLGLFAAIAARLLAFACCGLHSAVRKCIRRELGALDFLRPVLFLVAARIWIAVGSTPPLAAGVIKVGLLLIFAWIIRGAGAEATQGRLGS